MKEVYKIRKEWFGMLGSKNTLFKLLTLVILALFSYSPLSFGNSQSKPETGVTNADIQVSLVVSGLNIPWGMAFIDDSRLLVTERSGSLKLADIRHGTVLNVTGVKPVYAKGQGGLLDVAVRYPYKKNEWIYFTYSKRLKNGAATTLARAKFSNDKLVDWNDLLVTKSVSDTNRHFGSRIAFADSNTIFFTIGDRGVRPNGQALDTHSGKILRVDLTGAPKKGNPFIGKQNTLPEIWSYGHRNPQGIVYDSLNKRLWAIEHGPRGGDEINLVKPGLNYGWPIVSHGKEYWGPFSVGEAIEKPGMENPKKVYIPSIAPSSLMLYTGDRISQWKGNLFAGALVLRHLNRIVLDKDGNVAKEERLLEELDERVRAVVQGPDELVYISTDNGNIYQIRPK